MNEKVIKLLCGLSGLDNVSEEDTLLGTLGFDSLNMITMLIEIESAFNIRLNESDMNPYDLIRVSDVISLVGKYIGG